MGNLRDTNYKYFVGKPTIFRDIRVCVRKRKWSRDWDSKWWKWGVHKFVYFTWYRITVSNELLEQTKSISYNKEVIRLHPVEILQWLNIVIYAIKCLTLHIIRRIKVTYNNLTLQRLNTVSITMALSTRDLYVHICKI